MSEPRESKTSHTHRVIQAQASPRGPEDPETSSNVLQSDWPQRAEGVTIKTNFQDTHTHASHSQSEGPQENSEGSFRERIYESAQAQFQVCQAFRKHTRRREDEEVGPQRVRDLGARIFYRSLAPEWLSAPSDTTPASKMSLPPSPTRGGKSVCVLPQLTSAALH